MALTDRDRACFGPRNAKPPGSIAWCWQTIDLLKHRWTRKDLTDQQFEETLGELRQHAVWTVVPHERPYGSLEALLQAEIGATLPEARAAVHALQAHGSNQHTAPGVDNIKSPSAQGGTSAHYLLARLKRDRPDLAEAYAQGEYRSVRAAAKVAGWIPDPTPLDLLRRAWDKASDDERKQFVHEKLREVP